MRMEQMHESPQSKAYRARQPTWSGRCLAQACLQGNTGSFRAHPELVTGQLMLVAVRRLAWSQTYGQECVPALVVSSLTFVRLGFICTQQASGAVKW